MKLDNNCALFIFVLFLSVISEVSLLHLMAIYQVYLLIIRLDDTNSNLYFESARIWWSKNPVCLPAISCNLCIKISHRFQKQKILFHLKTLWLLLENPSKVKKKFIKFGLIVVGHGNRTQQKCCCMVLLLQLWFCKPVLLVWWSILLTRDHKAWTQLGKIKFHHRFEGNHLFFVVNHLKKKIQLFVE